jgi:hypothetical protein
MNKKLFVSLGMVIILIGAAAFLAGRLLHRGMGPLSLFAPADDGISILPAEELPKRPPEVEGLFVERQDSLIIVEDDRSTGDSVAGSPVGIGGGPKSEVVITADTQVYHDTTQPPDKRPSGNDPRVIQQTVEDGMLDDLIASQSLIMAWGRKSGDRIIAEVVVYLDLGMPQKP